MRWITSLAVLSLMMALFHRLTAAGPLEARATLALGFLLLAAHLGGQLAARVRVPRITAYLLVGFAVGPWLGLVRPDEVGALTFISNAAVALIAFAAGGELRLETLRRERTALIRVSAGAVAAPFVAVTAVLLALSPWFPLTVHQPIGDAAAVALVLGLVAAAFSPAATMALMDELGARGPFARSVLTVTVVGDVALIILLTLVFAIARPLTSAGALSTGVVWSALAHLVGSLGAGLVLGALVAQYLRFTTRDTPLFLVAVAFVTAEVARLLGLEALLVALTAGFFIENFSRVEGERIVGALHAGSRPVYVVFFALAGAGLELQALAEMWSWVLVLVGLRAAAIFGGVRWAGRHPSVTPVLARDGWLGLISQAGLALGLATVARRAFPEWGVSLEALIVAMIGVHEALGPICFRRALVRAGEVTEGEHVAERPAVADGGGGVLAGTGRNGGGV
ncbi:MAG: cation:proton antiporter [Gemmatimonadales bacterium]